MEQQQATQETVKVRGQVKWFNSKKGFGFIKYKDSTGMERDIFVHHTCIKNGSSSSFRNLVTGEYCEFVIADCPGKQGQVQAEEVTGIEGGPLLSEIRTQYSRYNPHTRFNKKM